MKKIAFLLLLLIVAGAVYVFSGSVSSLRHLLPEAGFAHSILPSHRAAPASPARTPDAPTPDPLAVALATAQSNAQKAKDAYDALVAGVKDRVKTTPQYQAAAKLEDDVEAARAQNSPDLPTISAQRIDAKSKLAALEFAALSSPELKTAKARLTQSTAAVTAAKAAIAARAQQAQDAATPPPATGNSIFGP